MRDAPGTGADQEREALRRQVPRHRPRLRRPRRGEIQQRRGRGAAQARRIDRADRAGRVAAIRPVAVRVEVLDPVQGAAEPLHGLALGPAAQSEREGAVAPQPRLRGQNAAPGVERAAGRRDPLPEARLQVGDAAAQRLGGLPPAPRIARRVQIVRVVAVRRGVEGLVRVRRADRPERPSVARELIEGARFEAGAVRRDPRSAGQCRPGDPLVLRVLPERVDRAEGVGGPGGRQQQRGSDHSRCDERRQPATRRDTPPHVQPSWFRDSPCPPRAGGQV